MSQLHFLNIGTKIFYEDLKLQNHLILSLKVLPLN